MFVLLELKFKSHVQKSNSQQDFKVVGMERRETLLICGSAYSSTRINVEITVERGDAAVTIHHKKVQNTFYKIKAQSLPRICMKCRGMLTQTWAPFYAEKKGNFSSKCKSGLITSHACELETLHQQRAPT